MGITLRGEPARVAAGLAALSLAAVGFGLAAQASAASSPTANPYSPANGHVYRHGVIPTIAQNAKMKQWAASHAAPKAAAATGPETLAYGGGVNGVGVLDGHAKVYVVFYGSQWGAQSTDAGGDVAFTGDPDGAAHAAQEVFKGIGTGGERWSATLTQWCDGPGVSAGATNCPATGARYVPYMSGGVLSGVWYDNSTASPSASTGNQLGQEAVAAAAHFGNTTSAANRDAYYVILSPHGTDPDNYQDPKTGYCAWHDYTGDSQLSGGAVNSPFGDLAFSNQPYNMDFSLPDKSGVLQSACGVNFVNSGSAGSLDGYTITMGHEFAEMASDQFPSGGWTNQQTGTFNGQENGDECAWLAPGTAGGAGNVAMGTGSFAMQATWSNDTNRCDLSHAIVSHGGSAVTVTNPGNQITTAGSVVSLQVTGSDTGGASLQYSATGLPAGLTISSSGLISGAPTSEGTSQVTVTASDSSGAAGSTSFSWTITKVQGWPTLQQGQSGRQVTTVQYLLNAHGAALRVDGRFGSATVNAVRSFESSQGLPADGIVSSATWQALIVTVRQGDSSPAVKGVQAELKAHGFTLTVDGRFGSATVNAVRSFQSSQGLTSDGIVSSATWQALVS